jgi:Zn-finger protein
VYRLGVLPRRVFVVALAGVVVGCGARPLPPRQGDPGDEPRAPPARRAASADDCAVVPGRPPPEPLRREYEGVARSARCQREVYTIMGGIAHFVGQQCSYCHIENDYPKMTNRKQIANWMARELVPNLRKKGGGDVWCGDCHLVNGKGTAKILGSPRDESRAIEWMTTHMVDRFETADGRPLYCETCHGGRLGSPEFRRDIILQDLFVPASRAGVAKSM